MKKKITIAAFCLIFCSIVNALEYSENLSFTTPIVIEPRTFATGGMHFASYDNYFTILSNPANLGLSGDKKLFPIMSAQISGPLTDITNLIDSFSSWNKSNSDSDRNNFINNVSKSISDNNGLNLAAAITGPFSFGAIKKNFGWGIFNNTTAGLNVSSITRAALKADESIMGVWGYGLPVVSTETNKFALGVDLKGVVYTEAAKTESVVSLLKFDIAKIPIAVKLGLAADFGATYVFKDILSVGIVWRDLYIATSYNLFQDDANTFDLSTYSEKGEWSYLCGKPSAGVQVNIPIGWTKGVLSSWKVMVDYADFYNLISELKEESLTRRNPILDLSLGMEFQLFNTIALRAGVHDTYFCAGAGIDLSIFHINIALYTNELGYEPGSIPQMNAAVSAGFYY